MRIEGVRGLALLRPALVRLCLLALSGGCLVPASRAASSCKDGSCTFDPTGGAGGSVGGGGGSIRSMERDWRTRLLLDNLGREGYDAAESDGAMAPLGVSRPQELRRVSVSYFGSFQVSQYPPFDDSARRSVKDTEYSVESAVDLVYSLDERTDLLGRLSLRHEWSKSDPNSFARYETWILRVDAGMRRRVTDDLTLTLKVGSFGAEAKRGDPADDSLDPELLYLAELEYRRPRYMVRAGTYRDVFGSPEDDGYHLARVYVDYLEGNVNLREDLNLNVRANHLRFTDDTENYESVEGLLTYYPGFLPERFGISAGGQYEFREDENETIWIGGVEWGRPLGERNSLFTSGKLYANTTTGEREVVSEVVWGHLGREGRHGGAVGLSLQWEYQVYDRYSTFLFFRLY